MRSSPFLDICQNLGTHFPQGLFIHLFSALSFFQVDLSYHFPLAWTSRLQNAVGHPDPTVTDGSNWPQEGRSMNIQTNPFAYRFDFATANTPSPNQDTSAQLPTSVGKVITDASSDTDA